MTELIKKLALLTAIAMLAALPLPMWNATRGLVTRPSLPWPVWTAVGIAYIFSAILPLFYFALWRNEGDVAVSRRLRWICLVGLFCGMVVIRNQMPVTTLTTLLSMLSTMSCMALLIAMFLKPGAMGPKSKFLRSMTWTAMIGGLLWLGINLMTLVSNANPGAMGTLFEQVCLFTAPFLVAVAPRFR